MSDEWENKTGGHAFPVPETEFNSLHDGMTLRDYFAAKAMQSLMVGASVFTPITNAANAYEMADAMLSARGAK